MLQLNDGNLAKEEYLQGVRVIRVKSRISRYTYDLNFSLLHFLAQHLGEIDPDIIHVHHYRSLLTPEVLLLLRRRGYPIVITPHYERLGHNTLAGRYLFTLYRNATKQMLQWPDKVVANTEYTKKLLVEDFELEAEKVAVIPNGVDRIELHEKGRIKRSANPEINLLSAGYLDEKKGIQYMLCALRELRNKGYRARLTVIGKGGFKPTLERVARECGVDDLISWEEPVPQDELYQKLADADIFFLLSREESYGIVVAEALAMGTPCIVSNTTALGEFTREPGCFGIDYPANPKELSDLVLRICTDGMRVGPFSDKIRTWENIAADYERLFQGAIDSHRRQKE